MNGRFRVTIASLFFAAALILLWYERSLESRAALAHFAAGARLRRELDEIERLRARQAAFGRERSEPVPRKPVDTSAAPRGGMMSSGIDASRFAADPTIRSDIRAYFRAIFDQQYRPFLVAHGLSQGAIDQFLGLMLERGTLGFAGIQVSFRPENIASRDIEQQMEQLLGGAAGMSEFREYASTLRYREVTQALAGNLYDSDAPLTGPQADQLTEAILSSRTHSAASPWDLGIDWDSVLAKSAGILSPPQLSALRDISAMLKAGVRVNSLEPGAFGAVSAPPVSVVGKPR
jgi:hypothetical protein